MSTSIKTEFGRRLRMARDAKRMSRATLAVRLGISPKTIQSWEMGRTFIEKLDLIPALEHELDINISAIIAQAVTPDAHPYAPAGFMPPPAMAESGVAESRPVMYAPYPAAYGPPVTFTPRKQRPKLGPVQPQFTVHPTAYDPAAPTGEVPNARDWVAIPMLTPQAMVKPVADLDARDVVGHVLVPADWMPRGGVMVAVRMGDSALTPAVPIKATMIVDRRPQDVEKDLGRVLAFNFEGKGLRIRRLMRDMVNGKYFGSASYEQSRNRIPYRPDKGDEIVGKVVGWFTEATML